MGVECVKLTLGKQCAADRTQLLGDDSFLHTHVPLSSVTTTHTTTRHQEGHRKEPRFDRHFRSIPKPRLKLIQVSTREKSKK